MTSPLPSIHEVKTLIEAISQSGYLSSSMYLFCRTCSYADSFRWGVNCFAHLPCLLSWRWAGFSINCSRCLRQSSSSVRWVDDATLSSRRGAGTLRRRVRRSRPHGKYRGNERHQYAVTSPFCQCLWQHLSWHPLSRAKNSAMFYNAYS